MNARNKIKIKLFQPAIQVVKKPAMSCKEMAKAHNIISTFTIIIIKHFCTPSNVQCARSCIREISCMHMSFSLYSTYSRSLTEILSIHTYLSCR